MVKIIDGEIYQDNDPRLKEILQRQQGGAQGSSPSRNDQPSHQAAQATGGGMGPPSFDFNAPPFRVVEPPLGQQRLLGLPDVEVFGMRIPAAILIGLAGLMFAFGWKGLVGGAILYYIYHSSTPQQQGPGLSRGQDQRGGVRGGGRAPPQNMFRQLQDSFTQQFGGEQQQQQGQARGTGRADGSGFQAGGAGGSASSGPFAGKGHKLGS